MAAPVWWWVVWRAGKGLRNQGEWTQTPDSVVSEFIPWCWRFPAEWPWAHCLPFLSLSFPIGMRKLDNASPLGFLSGFRETNGIPAQDLACDGGLGNHHFYLHFREYSPPCHFSNRIGSLKSDSGLSRGALKDQGPLGSGCGAASAETMRLVDAEGHEWWHKLLGLVTSWRSFQLGQAPASPRP